MLFQLDDILRAIAYYVGLILNFLKPYILPVGEWMIIWVEYLLNFFPTEDLTIYFAIFIFLIVIGAIVNSKWPGDKPKAIKEKKGERIDDSVAKCSNCGNALGDSEICPYCGHVNK